MRQIIGRILQYYGSTAEILGADGGRTVRAFIQPVTGNGWESVKRVLRDIGQLPMARYVYIGPAEILPEDDAVIVCGGRRYRVCRMERMVCADEAVYVWGLLRAAGGDGDAAAD